MRTYLMMAAALVALAACSGSSDKKAETAATPSPAAAETVAAAAPAAAPLSAEAMADLDKVQAGKWEITTSMMGQSMPAMEVCYDKSMTFQEAQEAQKQAGVACTEQSYRREGDRLIGHSVCSRKMGGEPIKMTTDMVITGDLKTAYTMETTSKMEPAPAANMGEMNMTISAKRIGDCEPAK